MATKKYVSLNKLSDFLSECRKLFAAISHKHKISDLTDYKVDAELSATSTNPVQNKVIDAEFDAISQSFAALESVIDDKADASHSHNDVYYTETEVDALLENKADSSHSHSNYVPTSRTVNGKALSANITLSAGDVGADASGSATSALNSAKTYTNDAIKALGNTYYTETEIDSKVEDLNTAIDGKADASHSHDDVYYTETEVNTLLAGKSDTSHTHSNYVPTSRTINGKSLTANISLSASDVGALPVDTDIPDTLADLTGDSTHRTVTDAEKAAWNAKSNFSGDYNDLINQPTIPSISGLATETYVDEAVEGKADSEHAHAISDVTNLQSTLNAKAAQTSLDSHTGNTTVHITATERTNWNAAKTHADSAHAPSNAEKNQNAFSNVTVGGTTIAADTTTDTLTLVAGTNVTITPDATNDKITISATDTNTTYSAGTGISLSGTTFSNSGVRSIATGTTKGAISVNTNGTTASVPVYGLGSAAYTASTAYDSAGSANTALANAKTYTDGKIADLINSAPTTLDTLGEIATAMEENADVVEALETAIGTKSASGHTHTVSHTPAGTVGSKSITPAGTVTSTFTGTEAEHSHTFTGTAATHKHTFSGTKATISATYTPVGSVSQPTFSGTATNSGAPNGTTPTTTVASSTHTHKYTPAGTVSKPTFTGSATNSGTPSKTAEVYSITGVGSVPSLSASVTNKCLTLTFGAGSVPTRSKVTVASSDHTHSVTATGSVSQPTFTGSEASTTSITGTASVASSGHTHSVTATGTVSKPTFTGTEDTISASYTPAGSIAETSVTPAGSVSTVALTPAGSVSSTFKGTAASHDHSFTGTAANITTSGDN